MKHLSCVILVLLAGGPLTLPAQNPTTVFATGTQADEVAIRALIDGEEDTGESPRIAANLDWENAFGIRYTDLKKRNDFYGAVVKPLQASSNSSILEVKTRFLTPTIAVADEYWHIIGQLDSTTHRPGPDRWGRTTFVFEKAANAWTMVLSRVADLRDPYYKHFDALPAAVAVPAGKLASYAGRYQFGEGRYIGEITVSGDHLLYTFNGKSYIAIPTSDTEFLAFRPDDLASYEKLSFSTEQGEPKALTVKYAWGEPIATGTRSR